MIRAFLLLLALLLFALPARADSPTYRGNPQRTGAFDAKAIPTQPKVLWVYKGLENFVASPVPDAAAGGGSLFASSLGPFNVAQFHALTLDAKAQERIRWTKSSPAIKMPTVCSPAIAGDLLIFGDGMHQTDGATLYAFAARDGMPLWRYSVPGKLVHMECPPTIHGDRVFIGAGDAGVLAVDARRVLVDGKEQPLDQLRPAIEAKYAAAMAKYQEARQRDPDMARPPDDNAITRAAPKLLWQKGKNQWHVDAPLAVTPDGTRLLVASAYIDEDKAGKRVLLCLNAADGAVLWEYPLTHNPWGGPTIAGDIVLVGCSSIRYDVAQVGSAKGEVLALDLATGKLKWSKQCDGGILAPVAVLGDFAIYTCTNRLVYAAALATGQMQWRFTAKHPIFAAPAVAHDTVVIADLHGTVHALDLANGAQRWSLDVPNAVGVQTPGLVYASPAIFGGRIYLATNNLHGEHLDKPGAIICIGDERDTAGARTGPLFTVDRGKKLIRIPCTIAPRKLATLKDIYPLEVIATYPSPEGQKAHETVVAIDPALKPSQIHKAIEALGGMAGAAARNDGTPPRGSLVKIFLRLSGPTGKPRVIPIERTIVDTRTNKTLPPLTWHFTGSNLRQIDPDKPEKTYGADLSGTFIAIYPVTDETLVQSTLTMEESSVLKLDFNRNIVPPEGTPVELLIEVQ